MKTMILLNPKARDGQAGSRWGELEKQVLEALGESKARVERTTPEDHGTGIVRRALGEGFERIVVVGGDGTVADVVQGFFDSNGKCIAPEAALAILPAGRGDDFFKSISGGRIYSSEKAWERGLAVLREGKAQPTDMGRADWLVGSRSVGKRYFVNVLSFGFPGLVVKNVKSGAGLLAKSALGKSALTYVIQSGAAMAAYKPVTVRVKVDGKDFFEGKIFSGFVLNGSYNAGGVCWDDEARIDDGVFSVLVTEPAGPFTSLARLGRMGTGNWKKDGLAHRGTGKRVEVTLVDPPELSYPLFEIDGDQPAEMVAPSVRGGAFEILPGAIKIWR